MAFMFENSLKAHCSQDFGKENWRPEFLALEKHLHCGSLDSDSVCREGHRNTVVEHSGLFEEEWRQLLRLLGAPPCQVQAIDSKETPGDLRPGILLGDLNF